MYPGQVSRLSEVVVASTTSIDATADLIRVTGTTSIATINPPPGLFNSLIFIVPTDGTVATVTTGNILVAVSIAVNRVTPFVFSRATQKWYPGAIS